MEPDPRLAEASDDMTLINSRFEIIPIRSVEGQLGALPAGATVTVTSSPRFGISRTLEYVEHLAEVVDRFRQLDVRDVFVIAGDDRRPAGDFECAYDLLSAMENVGHRFERVGIACYPEGH